jgi:excisionase family DNA binding protein
MPTDTNAIALLKTNDVAKMLGLNEVTVNKWAREGFLPSIRFRPGGHLRFEQAAIERFIAQRQSNYDAINPAE